MDLNKVIKGSITAHNKYKSLSGTINKLAKTIQKIQEEQAAERAAMSTRFATERATMSTRFATERATMDARFATERAAMSTRFAAERATMDARFAAFQGELDQERANISTLCEAFDGNTQAIGRIRMRKLVARGEERWIEPQLLPPLDGAQRLAHATKIIQERINTLGLGGADSELKCILPMDSAEAQKVLSALLESEADTIREKGNYIAHESHLEPGLYGEAIRTHKYSGNARDAQERYASLLRFISTPTAQSSQD
ncbi:hypothetical protein BD779DRAFT_1541639 [Infundibulicybe gibba]|nr:hypothetical protein BD779DRAFT_1541639 [Infundibulicybe gibba]